MELCFDSSFCMFLFFLLLALHVLFLFFAAGILLCICFFLSAFSLDCVRLFLQLLKFMLLEKTEDVDRNHFGVIARSGHDPKCLNRFL